MCFNGICIIYIKLSNFIGHNYKEISNHGQSIKYVRYKRVKMKFI